MLRLVLAVVVSLPSAAFAVGLDDPAPPPTTPTTAECIGTQVYDEKTQTCVEAIDSHLSDDVLYQGARELAYAGRFDDAIGVLHAMARPNDDRVLTYLGFAHRANGDIATGLSFYDRALAANPDNLLARSYLGQAHVLAGNLAMARVQHDEILARGGVGAWPEVALRMAIQTGRIAGY